MSVDTIPDIIPDTIPDMMRALILDSKGEIKLERRPTPRLPEHSAVAFALVRVRGFGVNRADLLQRDGYYPPPRGISAEILGLEFAGELVAVSPLDRHESISVPSLAPLELGDRVMGICAGAAYAEYVVVPLAQLLPVPEHFSLAEAAGFTETHLTAFDALTYRGAIRPGARVLIHAIGSGVGTAAAHLASLWGAEVVGTTRSPWKRERALTELPISDVWCTQEGFQFAQESAPFNLILDFVGATYLKQNIKLLALEGRLIVIGLLGGTRAELNLGLLLAKRAQIIGTTLRSRSVQEKIELTQRFRCEALPHFLASDLTSQSSSPLTPILAPPHIAHITSAEQIEEQHLRLRRDEVWSKLVCIW